MLQTPAIRALLIGTMVFTVENYSLAQNQGEPEEVFELPRVDVIGKPEDVYKIPGSATVVSEKELENSRVFTINEALRKVPGIHVRDEEGFGLRPNIGVRGLNPTRSTKITLLEDGIPLSYAPYGDNASYYHPPIDRYQRIEVLKGAGQIRFGPQTIGSVINYITPVPPREFSGSVAGALGNRDYRNGHVRLGGKGLLLDFIHKQGDGARDNINSELNDLNLKGVFALGNNQALTVRANYFMEDSQVTYSGITDAELQNFGFRYNPFENDNFESKRYGASLTHDVELSERASLVTNVYYAGFDRDWWRQASTTNDAQCGAAFVTARANGVRVDPNSCNSIQGRLRYYTNYGIEPRFTLEHNLLGIQSEFEAAVKVHFETQDRIQKNGTSPEARDGTVVEDNERETKAYSAFAQNRLLFGKWAVTPGVRVERVSSERTNNLTRITGEDTLTKWIPSLGVTYSPTDRLTIFAGAHKGFAPPRTEDIISGTGTSTEVGPEDSTNFEVGVRATPMDELSIQASIFRNQFDRLIAVGSIAGGNTPLAEGEALFEGVELAGNLNLKNGIYLRGTWTYLPTADQETPFRQVVGGAIVPGSEAGKRQPYAPENQIAAALGYAQGRLTAQLEAVFVDDVFSDFANTGSPPANGNGQIGTIDSYTIYNIAVSYRIPNFKTTLFFTAKNVTDEDYIVDRTRGIQVGMPRLVQLGLKYDF